MFFDSDTKWDSGTLTLTLKKAFLANIPYGFAVKYRSGRDTASGCSPLVSAISGTGVSIPAASMTGTVGKVDGLSWKIAKIGQVTTRPDSVNYICVTLQPNVDFKSTSAVGGSVTISALTISGLKGSLLSTGKRTVSDCPKLPSAKGTFITSTAVVNNLFKPAGGGDANTFDFDSVTGTLKLELNPEGAGILKGGETVFAIPLRNSVGSLTCNRGGIKLSSSGMVTAIDQVMTISTTDRALVDGRADGDACPLQVYGARFLTAKVTQSNAMPNELNMITATLKSNFIMSRFPSIITISGLTGSATKDGDVTILSGGAATFTPKVSGYPNTRTLHPNTRTLALAARVLDELLPPGKSYLHSRKQILNICFQLFAFSLPDT